MSPHLTDVMALAVTGLIACGAAVSFGDVGVVPLQIGGGGYEEASASVSVHVETDPPDDDSDYDHNYGNGGAGAEPFACAEGVYWDEYLQQWVDAWVLGGATVELLELENDTWALLQPSLEFWADFSRWSPEDYASHSGDTHGESYLSIGVSDQFPDGTPLVLVVTADPTDYLWGWGGRPYPTGGSGGYWWPDEWSLSLEDDLGFPLADLDHTHRMAEIDVVAGEVLRLYFHHTGYWETEGDDPDNDAIRWQIGFTAADPNAKPAAGLIDFGVTDTTVGVGESFELYATMRNTGTGSADHGGITVSFPSLWRTDDQMPPYDSAEGDVELHHADTTFDTVRWHDAYDWIYFGDYRIRARHLLVEADNPEWLPGETQTLRLIVTPKEQGVFKARVRSWLAEGGEYGFGPPVYRDPNDESNGRELDQQVCWSEVLTVNVLGPGSDLRELADAKGVHLGGAVNDQVKPAHESYDDLQFQLHFGQSFNMATLENEHKAAYVWTGPYTYDFSEADKIVDWCINQGMEVKYHTMIWHDEQQGVPDWLRDGNYEPTQIQDMTRHYIEAILTEYQGRIRYYDVVNEWAISGVMDPNDPNYPDDPNDLNWWRANFGLYEEGDEQYDVLEAAFKWAAEKADSLGVEAVLIYNDYGMETVYSPRGDEVYDKLIQATGKPGVRIDAVGFQSHFCDTEITDDFLNSLVWPQFVLFRFAGFQIYVSEFDTRGLDWAAQGQYYQKYLTFCLDFGVEAFQMWDFWDGDSPWCPPDCEGCRPGLFHECWNTKPSYDGFYDALDAYEGGPYDSGNGTELDAESIRPVPPP